MTLTRREIARIEARNRPVLAVTASGEKLTLNLQDSEAYLPATLANGWSNVGGVTPPAGWHVNPFGEVRVRGRIEGGTITNGTVLLVLPVGARPESEVAVLCSQGAGVSWCARIAANGEITCQGLAASTDVALDNITFRSA